MSDNMKKLWYDWLFLVTVGLFVAAIVFVVLDSIFAYRFTRIIVSLLGGGICGIMGMSVAEDIDIEFRCTRKYKEDLDNGQ